MIRLNLNPGSAGKKKAAGAPVLELYNLKKDPSETTDVAKDNPEIVAKMLEIAKAQHVPTKLWPIKVLDGGQ